MTRALRWLLFLSLVAVVLAGCGAQATLTRGRLAVAQAVKENGVLAGNLTAYLKMEAEAVVKAAPSEAEGLARLAVLERAVNFAMGLLAEGKQALQAIDAALVVRPAQVTVIATLPGAGVGQPLAPAPAPPAAPAQPRGTP